MPELPEVENIARYLAARIVNLVVERLYVRRADIIRGTRLDWQAVARQVRGQKVVAVTRRGKRLLIRLAGGWVILVQLGMTGGLAITEPGEDFLPHTHFYLDFADGTQVRYVDPRRFGKLWFLKEDGRELDELMEEAGLGRLGPEPFDLTPRQFETLLRSERAVKTLLLDQARIAGLGNIYADESLFGAGIHPLTPAVRITPPQARKLLAEIKKVLQKSITQGGTTFRDFRHPGGELGRFIHQLKVYQRTGEPCPKCGTPIQRIVVGGRSTHFCPECQKLR